jgi:hypothetical protein
MSFVQSITQLSRHAKKNLSEKEFIKTSSLNFEWLFDSKNSKDEFEDKTIPSTFASE